MSPQQDVSREILIEDEIIDNPIIDNLDENDPFLEDNFPNFDLGEDGTLGGDQTGGGLPQWIIIATTVLVAAAALFGLWWFGIPALEQRLRSKRRAKIDGRRADVAYAWEDLTEALTELGLPQGESETRHEYVERVAPRSRLDHDTMGTVALLTDRATYSEAEVDDDIARQARHLVRSLERELSARSSQSDRVKQRVHPGRLIREFRRR